MADTGDDQARWWKALRDPSPFEPQGMVQAMTRARSRFGDLFAFLPFAREFKVVVKDGSILYVAIFLGSYGMWKHFLKRRGSRRAAWWTFPLGPILFAIRVV